MAEIADTELTRLQQTEAFLKSLYDDPTNGMDFRKIVKKVFPKASIPELDAVTRTEEVGTAIEKRLTDTTAAAIKRLDDHLASEAKRKEDEAIASFESRLNKVVKDRGYTDDGKKKLLDLMKERGINDIEDAVLIFESRQPKPAPTPRQYSSRMPFITPDGKDDEGFKRLMEDPEQFMMDEMLTALNNPGEE